jgi:hypothetical protein
MNPDPHTSDRPNAPTPGNSLWAVWRRLRLVMGRDPVAAVTSPAAAVRLADETLALIAVAGGAAVVPAKESAPVSIVATAARGLPKRPPPFGAHVWTGLAVEPLAALLCAASPIGQGHGIEWVRDTAGRLDSADPDDRIWDCALESTPRGARQLRDALAHLRELEPRQRRSVTHVMVAAAGRLQRWRLTCRRYGQALAATATSVSARIFRRRMPDSAPTRAPGGTQTTSRAVLRTHPA